MRRRYRRKIQYDFDNTYYKPRGKPLNELEEVEISDEELETLRLRYMENLDQAISAKQMGISQSQYQRDLTDALKKITEALIEGKAINIKKRNSS